MLKNYETSEDLVRRALAMTRMNISALSGRLEVLNSAEFIAGSGGRMLQVRITSLRSRMLMKYFAVDQETNLVRSYSFLRGGLMFSTSGGE